MKKVLVFGTFDHLHPGHQDFFRQAKELGDYLIVVVATDQNVKKSKGQLPKYAQESRLQTVQKEKLVDQSLLGLENMDYLTTIKEVGADIIALGYDQKFDLDALKKELIESGQDQVAVVRLHSFQPGKYKSSLLK